MYTIIDGKKLAQKIRLELKTEAEKFKTRPKLAVILVGNDPASKIYVKNKNKACEEVGINYEEHVLEETTKMEDLLQLIDRLNSDDSINGILLQAPLPKHLEINRAFEEISPIKDVDGFNPINVGKLLIGEDTFISCTPYGIIKMLEEYNIPIQGKNAVVVGRSNIVGKPLAQCLLNKNATVIICHSKTENLSNYTKNADILISAVGKANLITADMVKEGATVIDVGMNRNDNGKLCGDASYITPVPGGVGPMTITMLMNNVIKAYKMQNNIK